MLDYATHAKAGSAYNTPPTYAVYIAGLVFAHLLELGGVAAAEERNRAKAELLYGFLDGSDFYANPVAVPDRSRMNVPFTLADSALDAEFLTGATERGLVQLKGHRSVGGMRASLYNAMPIEGVQALIAYLASSSRRRAERDREVPDSGPQPHLGRRAASGSRGISSWSPPTPGSRTPCWCDPPISTIGRSPRRCSPSVGPAPGSTTSRSRRCRRAVCRSSTLRAPTPTPSRSWCWPACCWRRATSTGP